MSGSRSRDRDDEPKKATLHTLLSRAIHHGHSWKAIHDYIQRHPREARERHYRHESPLQLALKAKGGDGGDGGRRDDGPSAAIGRRHVLRALAAADPASLHSRDEEGHTCLHTACAAGRSEDALRWLMEAERASMEVDDRPSDGSLLPEWNVTLRTDFPSGALPLHLIAACARFDCSSVSDRTAPPDHPLHFMDRIPRTNIPNIMCAYNNTTRIRQACPMAIWDRDCEGEIPLHAAASWGSVGSVLSLLIGAAQGGSLELRRAALMVDDRNKTPLAHACERVCSMCVQGARVSPTDRSVRRKPSDRGPSSVRRSIAREDPFEASISSAGHNGGRRSSLRRTGSRRRRIPGCGSSFRRSSISSSFVGGIGDVNPDGDGTPDESAEHFRASFISPRRVIDPCRGLAKLDLDGEEEFLKVEMLARAASGSCELTFYDNPTKSNASIETSANHFLLLHSVIGLDCRPEVVWHAAVKYPHEVPQTDAFGRTPLFIACERLAALYSSHAVKTQTSLAESTKEASSLSHEPRSCERKNGSNDEDKCTRFMESFLLGGDFTLSLVQTSNLHPSTHSTKPHPVQPNQLRKKTSRVDIDKEAGDDDLIKNLSLIQEVISFLLHSPQFGGKMTACTASAKNVLPLHVVLEAGLQWADSVEATSLKKDNQFDDSDKSNTVVQMLVDAYPRALEVQDRERHLFPFMIAATPKKLVGSFGTSNECTRQLETVYNLLRKAPTVLCHHL